MNGAFGAMAFTLIASAASAQQPRYLAVSNEGSRDITLIDARSGAIAATVPTTERPRGIHASADGSRLYVALSDDHPNMESGRDAIAVLDVQRRTLVSRFAAGTDPEQFGITPDGGFLYAANEDAGTAVAISVPAGKVIATLVVGIEPEGVAISPDGKWVYVTAETSNSVSVIDTEKKSVVSSFLVDVRPRAAAFSPDGKRAYVSNEISGTLAIIDVENHAMIESVVLGDGTTKPVGVVVSPGSQRIYVATGHGNSVVVLDAGTLDVLARIPVGKRPWNLALSRDGRWLYTANGLSNDVSVVDLTRGRVVATYPAGERPWGIALIY